VARLAELCRQGQAEAKPARGGRVFVAREARQEPIETGLRAALDDPDQHVLVGTLDGVPVGYAAARIQRLSDGTILGVVSDLYVEPPAREVGVGEALMDDVLAWCGTRGCDGVDAFALPGDRDTKNFFESNGFTARLLVVHRRMDRGERER
jgi:GNAT superfamily N-acetyltransferase